MKQTTMATVDVNRTPVMGDVIMIGNKTKIVIDGGRDTSEDRMRGDSYWVDYFDTIEEKALGTVNPKVTHYILEGGNMGKEKATLINPNDIVLVRSVKLSVLTEVKYLTA